jgi:hypothetical protein
MIDSQLCIHPSHETRKCKMTMLFLAVLGIGSTFNTHVCQPEQQWPPPYPHSIGLSVAGGGLDYISYLS